MEEPPSPPAAPPPDLGATWGPQTGTRSFRAGHVVLRPGEGNDPRHHAPQLLNDVYRLSDPALSELDLGALMDEILIRVREILRVDTVAILLHDPETDHLVARAAKGLEAEVEAGVRVPVGRGFAGHVGEDRAPVFIPDLEQADVVNPILQEIGIKSLLGVPLIVESELIGVMHVGTLTPRTFTIDDAALLELAAARVAPGIERARLFDALEREHRGAVALQRSLLPGTVPDLPEVDVAVRYLPARDEVGGDWYDVLEVPGGGIGVAIGDVVGHGVRAAALMAQLRTAVRAYAIDGHSPASVLERVDRLLQVSYPNGMATVAFAVVDPADGTVHLATAGHPPALVARPGAIARLADGPTFPPLGARPHAFYDEVAFTLLPGETLLLYTDGLVEARGQALGDRLARLCATAEGDPSPELLCSRLLHRMVDIGATEDDVAMVAIAVSDPAEELHVTMPAERDALAPLRRRLRAWLRAQGATSDELAAIVLASGEACANAVEHAYPAVRSTFDLEARMEDGTVVVVVRDHGNWREPRTGTHRGRGLGIMRATMDSVDVRSTDQGTEVILRRRLGSP
jgi:anti-sigma regulatory factor (Ser/Thr protein kinase)/putative methionine-R-sulfoxide reductase with GAF domain